jgi:EAL domain-containing protein (putative c-di-GMP-specific phosphodiesterase class I)
VKISLDDFGTAYSSLSYLHNFPFHKVKIDQSFLRDLIDDERRITLLRGMTRSRNAGRPCRVSSIRSMTPC